MPALLLSLKPRFASAIYSGIKRVEFRRVMPRCAVPIEAFIYETMPVGRVTGAAKIVRKVSGSIERLLELTDEHDPQREDYRRYLRGARDPCALVLKDARRFPEPRALAELLGPSARAPQSYCYIRCG